MGKATKLIIFERKEIKVEISGKQGGNGFVDTRVEGGSSLPLNLM